MVRDFCDLCTTVDLMADHSSQYISDTQPVTPACVFMLLV